MRNVYSYVFWGNQTAGDDVIPQTDCRPCIWLQDCCLLRLNMVAIPSRLWTCSAGKIKPGTPLDPEQQAAAAPQVGLHGAKTASAHHFCFSRDELQGCAPLRSSTAPCAHESPQSLVLRLLLSGLLA